jgi:hypothetical protein
MILCILTFVFDGLLMVLLIHLVYWNLSSKQFVDLELYWIQTFHYNFKLQWNTERRINPRGMTSEKVVRHWATRWHSATDESERLNYTIGFCLGFYTKRYGQVMLTYSNIIFYNNKGDFPNVRLIASWETFAKREGDFVTPPALWWYLSLDDS